MGNTENQKLSLLERVLLNLKQGDEAKVKKFFDKKARYIDKQVKGFEKNIIQYKDNIEQVKEDFAERIEDQMSKIDDVKLAVDIDSIQTNSNISNYIPEYLGNIKVEEDALKSLKEREESEIKLIEEKIAVAENQIKLYKSLNGI